MPVDTSWLLPAGIGVCYTLLLLGSWRLTTPRSQAVPISAEVAEIPFALREGQTIVGVRDTTKTRRFYIGNDVRDEQTSA
jgi:hypothetical protein